MLIQQLDRTSTQSVAATVGIAASARTAVTNTTVAPAATTPAPRATPEQVKSAVDQANQAIKEIPQSLEFAVDADTNKTIVKLIDTENGRVIHQFPSEEMLGIAKALSDLRGLLIQDKA